MNTLESKAKQTKEQKNNLIKKYQEEVGGGSFPNQNH